MPETLESLIRTAQEKFHSAQDFLSEFWDKMKFNYNPKWMKRSAWGGLVAGLIATGIIAYSDKESEIQETQTYLPQRTRTVLPSPVPAPQESPVSNHLWQNQPEPLISYYTDPIRQFSNDHVLVYCISQAEKKYAIKTLRQNNSKQRKITISGDRKKATMRDKNDYRVRLNFIVYGEPIPKVPGGYDLIAFRGHIQDMPVLYQELISQKNGSLAAPYRILLPGGCRSDQFIGSMAERNSPVITSRETAYGSQNSYMLVHLIEELPESSSWNDLEQKIKSRSERAKKEYIFPESPEYLKRIAIKLRDGI